MVNRALCIARVAISAAALMSISAIAGSGPALAVDFSGQRVEMIVPFQEGGGADTWARVVARFLGENLPGEPVVVIRNVPGGGSVIGSNYFQQHARPDGLMMLVASASLYFSYVLSPDDPRIQFDPSGYLGILASPLGNIVYARTDTGLTSAEELVNEPDTRLVIPASSATGGDIRTFLTLDMLDLEYDAVFGVNGSDVNMGMLRGEFNIQRDNTAAYLTVTLPLVETGEMSPLFTFGYMDETGTIVRDPAVPDLPNFLEAYRIVHGEDPSGPAFEAWKTFFAASTTTSKGLMLPAGTPDDILAAYDEAIAAMVVDPEFLAAAEQELGGYPQVIGPAARTALAQAWTMTPETRQWISDWLERRFGESL